MKKFFCIIAALLFIIVIYMLIVWFLVPVDCYSDLFATEQLMRIIAPKSLLFLIRTVFKTQLVIIFLFFCLSLLLSTKLKTKSLLIFSTVFSSLCAFVINVFLIKPRLIGLSGDYYEPHTVVQSAPALSFNVTMFDILFAICIGIITAILFIAAYKWYKTFAPSIIGAKE